LLEKPPKTPDNSSLPPSRGQKPSPAADGNKPPRKSRPGSGRTLGPNPDRIVDRLLDVCQHCAADWQAEPQTPQQVYDRIELPPIKPDVTRMRLFGERCACCGERATAAAPAGLEPGSPFGHIIRPSRGAGLVRDLFGDWRPQVWISGGLRSQRGHAAQWQICLAHLLRDAQYAIDCGGDGFSAALRLLLLRGIAIGRRRDTLRDGTLAQYRASLDRRLNAVLALPRRGEVAEKLRRRIARDREHLFVFVTDRAVAPTNNVSERALRPSVIFRKVTNGFHSEWGAQTYTAFRSVVSTAKLHKRSVLEDLRRVLDTPSTRVRTC